MKRLGHYFLIFGLLGVAVLVALYPQALVAPGGLLSGHHLLEADCFACHTPFMGAASKRCLVCHRVEQIGVLSTKGVPLVIKQTKTPFHQKLATQVCVVCHGEHEGVRKYRQQGRFSHQLLDGVTRSQCNACHQKPTDALHRPMSGLCSQCHGVTHWRPATFEHQKWFELDKDHRVKCGLCHERDNYKLYTCYGCHEHSVNKIREEHLEEGIRDYQACVLCHRNGDKDAAEWLWKSGRWREGSVGVGEKGQGFFGMQPSARKRKHKQHEDEEDDD